MRPKLAGLLLPLLLVLPVKGTNLSINGTSLKDSRGLGASRRVVRLYSGTRPKPIVCEGEGFQADPTDCTIFHRCMKNGNGRYVSFRFQCGPGTIYDPDKEICNHPQNTKRTECGASTHVPRVEFTFDNEISREVPSPLRESAEKTTIKHDFYSTQTTKRPDTSSFASKHPWISTSDLFSNLAVSTSNLSKNKLQQTKSPKTSSIKREITPSGYSTTPLSMSQQTYFSTTAKINFRNSSFSPQSEDICKSNGFIGDSENCRKFYRCISNQRGGFIRYEFLCSDPTIWDDDKKACNHVWAVKQRSCGKGSLADNSNNTRKNKQETTSKYTTTSKTTNFPTQSQLQINYGSKVTQTQTQISDGSVIQNQTQINFGNNKNGEPGVVQNQTQIIHGDAVSQTQTQINYADEAVQTQLQIDHSKESSQAQTQVTQSSSTTKTTQFNENQPVSSTSSNNGCTESGFMGDSEDCKKFYRCVDNGRGSFSRYDFSCGDGTVWDPKLEACNHAWAVKECGGKGSLEITSQNPTKTTQSTTKVHESASTTSTPTNIFTTTTTTTQSYYSSTEQESEDNNDIPYGNQPLSPTTNISIEQVPSGNQEPQRPNDNKCRSSGFMGDNKDCKKFYRCVDNGIRGYTRYEFSCGEGTVWDQRIEACNHAWAVQNCGGNANLETHMDKSTTTNVIHTTSTKTTSQTPPQNDDYDTGYGQQSQHDEQPPTIKTTTVKSTTTTFPSLSTSDSSVENICTSSGFMGDNNECKKFYRCVDNGNGGFTRYEFSCGEGTVWDPKIQACNHAWAVEKCGANSVEDINKIETTTRKDTEISFWSTTEAYEPDDNNNAGYGQQNQETHSTSSTTSHPENQSAKCTTSGFMGDPNECKKFYRCVDNGDGTFTRHEFSCGEGTVWDSKIDSCNHAWAVEKCGGFSTSTTSGPIQPTNNEENYSTYPIQSEKYPNQTTTLSTTTNSPNKDNNICKTGGFMSDTQDCKKFYRCVEDGHGRYNRYEFGCGEGTVWDQSIEACNHPWAVSGRCSSSENYNNSSNIQPTTQQYTTSSEIEGEDQGYNNLTTQKTSTSTSLISKPAGNKCTNEGFYGDENNCKNFYRCVGNGQGSFVKYEFSCGEGTVWNQDIQACDHESLNNQCSNMHVAGSTTKKPNNELDEMVTESTTNTSESSTANNENTNTSSKPQSSGNKCENEGFYGDPNDCKRFYRCVNNGKGDFTKYDFICGDGTIWDQEILACNHENSNNKCTGGAVSFTTTKVTPETVSDSSAATQEIQTTQRPNNTSTGSGGDQCTMEGFYANTNDCKKFYRCVANSKGGYTKYDFVCGEGTVWVQEIQVCDYDSDISSCSNKDSSSKPQTMVEPQSITVSSSTSQATTESQSSDKEDDEYPSENSSKPSMMDEECTSEGFFGDKNDCTRFYRCVDNGQGGYTKYDFTCGEGTAWDSNIHTCNHINEVERCHNTNAESQLKPSQDEGSSQTTESTSTTKETTSKPLITSNDKCEQEGYFGNTKDCTMFYRCVDNGTGGYTKYDFTCGEGTIWDQDVTTCNHPQHVTNPSCKNGENGQSSENSSSTESLSSTSSSSNTPQSSQGTTESNNQGPSNCSQESSSKKPGNQKVKCEKAGYYADPDDCKKFYRCVDWDGDGKRFSVYHFDCGEGTIWDPQLETCNHEDSVYPPRDCSGTQSQTGNVSQETTSSTTTTTTKKSTTSQQTSTTESTTTTQSTTEESTIQQSSSSEQTTQPTTTTEKTTTQEPSTSKQPTTEKTTTTTQQLTTSEKTTTQLSTTSEKTTTEPTTSEQTTTVQPTTSQQQTTQDTATIQHTTSNEPTTTEETTTSEPTHTQQSTTSEQTTQQMTTSQQTTQSSSSEQTTTQQSSTTEESSTDSTTTEQQSTTTDKSATTTEQSSEQNTTEQQTITEQEKTTTEGSTTTMTTEGNESTTESSQGTTLEETVSSEKDCPETEDDQYLYVCPTSFRRHPKYCNMFYQCTEDNDSHDVKITMFKCPNNTIYDESKTQCVEEDKADKKCDGQTAQRHRVKRLNSNFKEPIEASNSKLTCSTVGYYPFEIDNECSGIFLKCQTSKSGKLRGYVYRCPEGYTYWSISKRCEKKEYMKGCKTSDRSWRDRLEIPVEKKNIAKQ